MSQSRTMSLVESIANVLAGFGVAVATQSAIFPLFGLRTTLAANLAMGAIFTVVSIARAYCQPKAVTISSMLAPFGAFSIAISCACLLSARMPWAFGLDLLALREPPNSD